MKDRQLDDVHGLRRFAVVFQAGDDVMALLGDWARRRRISAASFAGIGAFRRVELGYFDVDARDYVRTAVDEQVEVLALTGNIALVDGEPGLHAHVVVGRRDATALGGHLLAATVRPTLELVVSESETSMRRRVDPATGLHLLDPEA